MENNLPEGWAETSLSEIAEINYGNDFRKTDLTEKDGYPVYSANGIIGYSTIYNRENETVVLGCRGSVGTIHLTRPKSYITHNCFSIEPIAFIEKKFIKYLLESADLSEVITGTAQPQITITNLSPLKVPVPPLSEQHRIVVKLDGLMEKTERGKKRLEKIPLILKRFRQSVLTAAVSGKLTEEWRKKNKKENAEELLQKIKKEIEENVKLKLRKKPEIFPGIEEEEKTFELPDNWKWVRLGELAQLINGDRGVNYPNVSEYVSIGVPWINTGHIEPDGTLSKDRMNYITKEKFKTLNSGKIVSGDLVYCLRGATLGKTAIVEYDEGAIASSLVIIRKENKISNRYIYYLLVSPFGRELINRFDNGTAQPNLSANSVKLYLVPLPSEKEQHEIVRRVEELFAFADKIETHYTKAKALFDKLPQSLLTKAFKGELVEQDENDEPASQLLERIQKETKKFQEKRKPKKQNTSKAIQQKLEYKPDLILFDEKKGLAFIIEVKNRSLTKEELYYESGLNQFDFLNELKKEIDRRKIKEITENGEIKYIINAAKKN